MEKKRPGKNWFWTDYRNIPIKGAPYSLKKVKSYQKNGLNCHNQTWAEAGPS